METGWGEGLLINGLHGLPGEAGWTTLEPGDRLDSLLPKDFETGAVSPEAVKTYLNSMMAMVGRTPAPLAILCFAVDNVPSLQQLEKTHQALIGRVLARCLRLETRCYDVVARLDKETVHGISGFLVVCPLTDEKKAAALAERLCEQVTSVLADMGWPWLTLSVGVSGLSLEVSDAENFVARAVSALYHAQRSGGRRIWRHSMLTA